MAILMETLKPMGLNLEIPMGIPMDFLTETLKPMDLSLEIPMAIHSETHSETLKETLMETQTVTQTVIQRLKGLSLEILTDFLMVIQMETLKPMDLMTDFHLEILI